MGLAKDEVKDKKERKPRMRKAGGMERCVQLPLGPR